MTGLTSGIIVACHANGDYKWLKYTRDAEGNLFDKAISVPAPMELRATMLQWQPDEINQFWIELLEFANANYELLMKVGAFESHD
jgi:hypothetical protein